MAQYKVLKTFKDKETGKTHTPSKEGETIELTVKRGTEINRNLKDLGVFVERAEEEPEPETKKED